MTPERSDTARQLPAQVSGHLRALYDASPDMIFFHDADGRVVEVNDNTLRAYGFTRDEMLGLPFATFTGGNCTMAQAEEYLRRARAGENPDFEWTARRKDGTEFSVEVRLRCLGECNARANLIAVVRDISDRKRAEAALRQSEERFRSLVETSTDWVWETDSQTRYSYVSPRAREILGYEPEEMIGRSPFEFVPPDELARVGAVMGPLSRARQPYDCIESFHRHKSGHLVLIETSGLPYFAADGTFLGYRGVDRDVTARRNAERQLREQETRYRVLVEAMSEGILVVDSNGMVLTCNPSSARILGVPVEELRGRPLLHHPWHAIREGGGTIPSGEFPFQIDLGTHTPQLGKLIGLARPDGARIWVEINGFPLFEEGHADPRGVLISFTDVTERRNHLETLSRNYDELEKAHRELKSVQTQLIQSEKMASIGHLAAGVAHEINNPVGYVNANLNSMTSYVEELFELLDCYDAAAASLPEDHPARAQLQAFRARIDPQFLRDDMRALLHESLEGVTRVKQIVKDLKDFARADGGDWQPGDLNAGLQSTLNIVWNELKYKTTVRKELGALPEVECIPPQINQVFMNLLVNAGHAISDHGEIIVSTGTRDDWVWIAVSDTGCGIPPENLSKLFDPFFTTKPVGQGTGLGLSISYNIVAKHHGRIEVQSEPGKGSTFTVWLPVTQPVAKSA